MEEQEKQLPKGADYTITVWLTRDKSKSAIFHITEMTEDVYLAAKTLIDKGKDFDAVRMIIKSLYVGGDPIDLLKGVPALQSASSAIKELLTPPDGELKKN